MQSVFRSTFVGVLALAALTACGDKNTTTPGTVQSVQVSPQSATINVGDHFTFVANVTATGNAARTVTWSTGDATIATVDANGVVTGVKGGNTSVIATSTADNSVKGAASITVGALVQPTVTIASINHTVAGTGSVPVDQSNVQGQIDVTVNVDAGSQKISTVSLIMSCNGKDTTVQTQTVSSGDLAPVAASEASSPVTFSFNTAAFNPATGAVAFQNGVCTIKASAVTTGGTIVASNSESLTLNNQDNVTVTSITTAPSAGQLATANDASGLVWHAGAVTVTAVPVIFSGHGIASATINLINTNAAAQVARGGASTVASGGTVATIGGVTPASGVLTATFPNSTSNGTGVGKASVNGLAAQVNTVDNTGNAGASSVLASSPTIRLDNLAPDIATTAPTFVTNTQNSVNGWVGKNFVFSTGAGSLTLGSAASDVSSAAAGSVPGVDNVVDTTQFSVGGGSFTNFSSVSSLAETSSGSTNTLRLKICDALGNCVNTNALGTFGVDLTPPSLSFTSGPKDGQVFNIASTVPANAAFGVSDTSNTPGVTASGSGANALLVTLQGLHPDSSSATASQTICDIGTSTGNFPAKTCKSATPEPGTFAIPARAGEYTLMVQAVDQAGNTSAAQTFKYYIDQAPPALAGGVAVPASITTGTQFASSAADSMDVASGNGFLHFGAPVNQRFVETGNASPTGVTFDNVLVRASNINLTLSTFYRSVTTAIDAAGVKPDSAGIRAVDAANNLSLSQEVQLPAANIAAGSTITSTGANGITSFSASSAPANPVDTLSTVALTATAAASSATSGSPFSQVCFYQAATTGNEGGAAGIGGAATGELVLIGCSSAETTTGVFPSRTLNYTVNFTAPAAHAASRTIYAVGVTAAGDALISSAITVTTN